MILIGQYVEWQQPAVYGALVTWPGKEYMLARTRGVGRLKFLALKRLMETPPRPRPISEACKEVAASGEK